MPGLVAISALARRLTWHLRTSPASTWRKNLFHLLLVLANVTALFVLFQAIDLVLDAVNVLVRKWCQQSQEYIRFHCELVLYDVAGWLEGHETVPFFSS